VSRLSTETGLFKEKRYEGAQAMMLYIYTKYIRVGSIDRVDTANNINDL
jgi:hypothetical protein